MSQMTLKIKKVGMKNPKTKVLGFASRAIANGTRRPLTDKEEAYLAAQEQQERFDH